jgi:hypothetical protein
MQHCPIAVGVADAGRRKPGVGGEDALERIKIARLHSFGSCDYAWIIGSHEADGAVVV